MEPLYGQPDNQDERPSKTVLIHVTTTIEHVQIILESIRAVMRLSDESVLICTQKGDVVHFPDFDGPLLLDDEGNVMGDSCYYVHWQDERSAEEIFSSIVDRGKLTETELEALSITVEFRNPVLGCTVEFCSLPPSEN
ncbi:MAG: hypothetical protein HS115_13900 [Spirochaetales bacterium]|nr:hypothetical protein [Spirochaetales bacterium]